MRGTSRIPGRQNACRCHGVALTGAALLAGAGDEVSESVEAEEAALSQVRRCCCGEIIFPPASAHPEGGRVRWLLYVHSPSLEGGAYDVHAQRAHLPSASSSLASSVASFFARLLTSCVAG